MRQLLRQRIRDRTNGSTTIVPAGATIANGSLVEVHLTGGNTATRIEVEDAEDVEFEPAEGEEVEVEGLVANLTTSATSISAVRMCIRPHRPGTKAASSATSPTTLRSRWKAT